MGLITNHSAIDRKKASAIDLIAQHKDLKLVALLAPEHGIRGDLPAGVKVADEKDPKTGVPVYSLYLAEDRGPTPEMLKDVDVLIYDLQEVGGRTWTYVSTMALSMQAAVKKNIPFVVLDRPNPIGGEIVEGALLDPKFQSFVGMYPIPARHGMTVGELATLFNQKHGIGANLIVAKVRNWQRAQWFDETGLPWINPSPNLRSLAALTNYPGSVYFEGTNLTEGRGTDRPFEQIGAPWLNASEVARTMNDMQLRGIRFEATTMPIAPTAAKFPGQTIRGDPFRHHGSAGVPASARIASSDRCDSSPASDRVCVETIDRSAHGIGQGAACDRRGHVGAVARAVGARGRRIPGQPKAVPLVLTLPLLSRYLSS